MPSCPASPRQFPRAFRHAARPAGLEQAGDRRLAAFAGGIERHGQGIQAPPHAIEIDRSHSGKTLAGEHGPRRFRRAFQFVHRIPKLHHGCDLPLHGCETGAALFVGAGQPGIRGRIVRSAGLRQAGGQRPARGARGVPLCQCGAPREGPEFVGAGFHHVHSVIVLAREEHAAALPRHVGEERNDHLRLAGPGRPGHDGERSRQPLQYGLPLLGIERQEFQNRRSPAGSAATASSRSHNPKALSRTASSSSCASLRSSVSRP